MRGRIGRFVQVDEAVLDVELDGSLQGRAARLQGGVVARAHHHAVIILQKMMQCEILYLANFGNT